MRSLLLALSAFSASAVPNLVRLDGMRSDGAPVFRPADGAVKAELNSPGSYPFKPFSADYVAKALATPTDWRASGAVTPAKDQGATGACGTFGRVAAAEGQFARHGFPLTNFSEEMLYSCVGWDNVQQQQDFFTAMGFMRSEDYPYNTSAPTPHGDVDPPSEPLPPGRHRRAAHRMD